MKWIKPIIAVFLLLTYSFAFAVELVPHCHLDNHVEYFGFEQEENHHHSNHQHVKPENKDSDDVLHKNHLDDNLLDFVICLLSELEHPELNLFHQDIDMSNLNNTEFKTLSKIKITAVLAVIFIKPVTVESRLELNINFVHNYQPFIVESLSHRGPPTFSC